MQVEIKEASSLMTVVKNEVDLWSEFTTSLRSLPLNQNGYKAGKVLSVQAEPH